MPDDMTAARQAYQGAPDDQPSSGRPGANQRRGRTARHRLAWAAVAAVVGCGLFALYLAQSRTAPFNSDGAANVLQGQAMVTGNPLLGGWWTSDVSFYTTELPEYALVTAIRGVAPDVVHLCGALTYTLTLLLALLLARGGIASPGTAGRAPGDGSTGSPGRANWHRAALAAGIMLAPGLLGGTEVFLENPDHAGTAVPVLFCLLLTDRSIPRITARGAKRWLGPAAVCALLTLAQVGDELALIAATVPLAAVCALRLCSTRLLGARLLGARLLGARLLSARPPGRRPVGDRLDGPLLAAAVLSVGLAKLANLTIRALGGFDLRPLGGVRLAPLRQVPANAGTLRQALILLFGANNPGPPRQVQTIRAHALLVTMADLHLAGLLVAGLGLAVSLAACLTRRADRVTAVLVTAVLAVLAAAVFTTVLSSPSKAHEIAILLPLSATLAGRVLPPAAQSLFARRQRHRRRSPTLGKGRGRFTAVATVALGVWLAVSLAELGYAAAWPPAQSAQQAVTAWLVAHHERAGLAGYWQANDTTVATGGAVVVAPITIPASSPSDAPGAPRASAYRWESSSAWYQPARSVATFVIAVTSPSTPGGGLSPAQVRASFGRPSAQHQVGQYLIMLYRHNLLARLDGTGFPGAALRGYLRAIARNCSPSTRHSAGVRRYVLVS